MPVDVLAAAADIAELIEAHADDAEAQRRLSMPTVDALTQAGLMRMCVPEAYGGPEVDPPTMLEAIATLAHADGAAGWCSMIASTTSYMSSFLPEDGAAEIYRDPSVVTGGVFAPNGRGTATERSGQAGFEVTGRWAWGSGTQHCDWVMGGTTCDDGTFRLCWFPRDDVRHHDTWYTSGMRGSGSLDYSVDSAFAPEHRTTQPGVTTPVVDCALARFPNFSFLASCVAAVGLGIARRSLDELNDTAEGKRPQYSKRTLAQSAFTQIEYARAEAAWRSARAFLFDEISSTWDAVTADGRATLDQRTGIRLAAVHAATTCASVADAAFTLAGGTAVYDTSVLGRCQRDAHVVTQHIQTAPKLNETLGKLLLGVETDTAML